MSLVINSNIMSLNAQRNLTSSLNEQDQAMERLTSGKRINSAADDAAGLSIASRMTSQISGLNQAVRNANDGQSLIQTAEGALDESTNILQRMRELSVQSANGTYDSGNRSTMNAEVEQLVAELDRISETTSFNGQNVLDGSLGSVTLQVGAEANQTIEMKIGAMDSKSLGLGSTSADVMGASITKANISLENNTATINGQSIMAIGETYDGATDNVGELVDAINTNVSGVSASTYAELTATTAGDGLLVEGTDTLTVTLTKLDGTTAAISVTDTDSLESLVDKLNEEGGGLLSASITDDNKLSISAENVASVGITDVGGAAGTIAASTEASIALSSDSGEDITIERGSAGNSADLTALGFRESNAAGVIEGAASDGGTTTLAAGDVTINGVKVGAGESGALQDTVAAINDVSDESGVTANAFTSVEIDTATNSTGAGTAAAFTINGVTIAAGADAKLSTTVTQINAKTADTGITAVLSGSEVRLEGDVASMTFGSATGVSDNGAAFAGVLGAGLAATTDINDGVGGVKLTSDSGSPISVDVTANGALATGLLDANTTSNGAFGTSLSSLDISTAAGAQKAIGVIDNALETINSTRGDLGAVANRLDFTVSNLSNVAENVSEARSRIEDADFAEESANLSRAQVLQQAGTAMLAQANAAPQQVLSLLQ
ncbi:flagellin [Amphritea sp. 1_MG-2023]|uniref:flagellin N-terminal helical domain-containing protein n=1 Tax=Amphritea sp. 1_MG-2023 TaxID=3062670 RepID=UPI0026E35EBD|nr:flagellin [Amphritea sp. 1_MG-2023]MDO6564699.1 flagellin [Amphritea sp. 1_MG-2023]